MECSDNASASQLTGFLGFVRRSGALAPFLNVLIISIVPFALVAMKDSLEAYGQPMIFWGLKIIAAEIFLTFIIGGIIAWRNPELLMTEDHQEKMKQIGEHGVNPKTTPQSVREGNDTRNANATIDGGHGEEAPSAAICEENAKDGNGGIENE